MRHLVLLGVIAAALGLVVYGCSQTNTPLQAPAVVPGHGINLSTTATVCSENLCDITLDMPLASGTGMVVAGTGLRGDPTVVQPGTMNFSVPGTVKQVILYWEGQNLTSGGDNTVTVNGNPVTGDLIGGPTLFFATAYSSTYRADITGLGLVSNGANSLTVGGMDFTRGCSDSPPDCRNNGAGVLVIYDDGGTTADLQVHDGNDCAFYAFTPPLDTTAPQTFNFAPATTDRSATISLMVSSVNINRPSVVEVTVGTGTPERFVDILDSDDGPDWDTDQVTVNVPAGETSVTVQCLSEKDATSTFTGLPASLTWIVGGFSITPEQTEQPGECRVTGGAVDDSGNWVPDTYVDGDSKTTKGLDTYTCGGQAGAPTALQPQPWGEWTHNQHKGPDGSFTFHAGTASAPDGTEIAWINCNDPGWCVEARPAPDKQIDFGGLGTFTNVGHKNPLNIQLDQLYYFEVNIDDLGEPGKGGKQEPPSADCPADGFGLHSTVAVGNCDCPDYYRITIYDGTDDSAPVLYSVQGYIRGGNFQIHPLTGYDQ